MTDSRFTEQQIAESERVAKMAALIKEVRDVSLSKFTVGDLEILGKWFVDHKTPFKPEMLQIEGRVASIRAETEGRKNTERE